MKHKHGGSVSRADHKHREYFNLTFALLLTALDLFIHCK